MKDFTDLILTILINQTGLSGDEDIKDIKDIIAYDFNYKYLIILLAIIIFFLLFFVLRKKKINIKEEKKQVLPPEVIAMDRINKLRESKLIEQGRYKEFYTIISEIIRDYFEAKYKISALDRTTYELVIELKNKNIFSDKVGIIQNFLFDCDLVKFAKYVPPAEDPDKMLAQAREIINIAVNENTKAQSEINSNV
ncbi:MAG: hypothetical protein PHX78_03970 [bacterium]|nr:hypothetical protein [bacterium]